MSRAAALPLRTTDVVNRVLAEAAPFLHRLYLQQRSSTARVVADETRANLLGEM